MLIQWPHISIKFPASLIKVNLFNRWAPLSLPVSREKNIDFPKHLVPPDPWPSDLQVRGKSGGGIEV